MKYKRAIVVCAGHMGDYGYLRSYFKGEEYIIGVDSGARHLKNMGIYPDLLVGDFDSILEEDLRDFILRDIPIIRYPENKNETDSELAVMLAADRGFKEIILMGALGLRFDHSMANVFLLKAILDRGIKGWIVDEKNRITVIDRGITLKKEQGIKVSLLPLGERVTGITTGGLAYPLKDAEMVPGPTRGISNEFDFNQPGDLASIEIKGGYLMVFLSSD